jgi:hypothetical protein
LANVPEHHLGIRKVWRNLRLRTMNLGGQAVEHAHLVSVGRERWHQMSTNESCPTGNQNTHQSLISDGAHPDSITAGWS